MRVQSGYVSVRKAFLELDSDHKGYITPEDLSKILGRQFNFSLVELLVKMKSTKHRLKINY